MEIESAPSSAHVLIAPDKFKGSLTAADVADAVAGGISAAVPSVPLRRLPLADGGDGTVAAALAAGFARVEVTVQGPTGEPVHAEYAVAGDTAIVELAEASGLRRLPGGNPAALSATSAGTGELIAAALDSGARRIVLGIGGSANTDGGAGMITALGARLLDGSGTALAPGGGALRELDRIDLSEMDTRLSATEFVLASDVDNPLLGAQGAATVYGPQKGAGPEDIPVLEAGLRRFAELAGPGWVDAPGAGAAGGVGFAALALLGARMRAGFDVLAELLGFDAALAGARLVVTGEGSLDEQTLYGKVPSGVATRARAAGIPVVAVAGRSLLDQETLHTAGITAAYPLTAIEPDPARCIAEAAPLLTEAATALAKDWLS
ncbi:glycerate kinase [Sciscionella sediminilitoris]|uniref:glycerate kinase n=1 Tax=Sciscionella sediminilitoris TaxID=1445613 RepID=UPI0004DFA9F7|nr:glycerate kinase [Sciscionella sp. SE31]